MNRVIILFFLLIFLKKENYSLLSNTDSFSFFLYFFPCCFPYSDRKLFERPILDFIYSFSNLCRSLKWILIKNKFFIHPIQVASKCALNFALIFTLHKFYPNLSIFRLLIMLYWYDIHQICISLDIIQYLMRK